MGIWGKVVKWVAEVFWPYFKDYIWPFIKENMKEILEVIEKIKTWTSEYLDKKNTERERQAKAKAEEAEKRASKSTSDEEINKLRAVAEVWREIADQYRRDNEDLKKDLDKFTSEAKKDALAAIDKLDISADFQNLKTVMQIGETKKDLPLLPQ